MSETITIGITEAKVATAPAILVSYGLGSCIAIALYDPETKVGGLAHPLLPEPVAEPAGSTLSAKYTNHAVDLLLAELLENGCALPRVVAKLAGGASMFDSLYQNFRAVVGERNLAAAKEALERHGIPIVAEDTGGDFGRSVEFNTATGKMVIRALHQATKII